MRSCSSVATVRRVMTRAVHDSYHAGVTLTENPQRSVAARTKHLSALRRAHCCELALPRRTLDIIMSDAHAAARQQQVICGHCGTAGSPAARARGLGIVSPGDALHEGPALSAAGRGHAGGERPHIRGTQGRRSLPTVRSAFTRLARVVLFAILEERSRRWPQRSLTWAQAPGHPRSPAGARSIARSSNKGRAPPAAPEDVSRVAWLESRSRTGCARRKTPAPRPRTLSGHTQPGIPGGNIRIHGRSNGLGWPGRAQRLLDWTAGAHRTVPHGTPGHIRP